MVGDLIMNNSKITSILKLVNKIQYDNTTSDESYTVKQPDELLKTKKGICYDIVELERVLFTRKNLEFKTYFSYESSNISESPTHTYLIFKKDEMYYWFESSWYEERGIHGPYYSYINSVGQVEKRLVIKSHWKKVVTIEYQKFDYKGLNISDFAKAIFNQNNISIESFYNQW